MAVNLSPVGGVAGQFFDNNGNPLAGGKIFTYSAGTTTNQATYTSASGAIAHSNPIILDGAGRVPSGEIWLTDGLEYKFVIKDSVDALIGTFDNIIGINSNFVNFTNEQEIQTATAGQTVFTLTTMQYQPGTNSLSVFVDGVNQYGPGALYAYVETNSTTVTFTAGLHVGAEVKFTTSNLNSSAGSNAFNVSYTPPFTGSVATNVGDKLAQTVSVKDFGAVGDGVADDTTAFTAALAASRLVVVPTGTYRLTSTITLNQFGQSLIGTGGKNTTVLSIDQTTGPGVTLAQGQCVLENLTIRATNTRQSYTTGATYDLAADLFGVKIYNASGFLTQCNLNRVVTDRHPNHGVYMGGEGAGTMFTQCESNYNRGHGYAFDDRTIGGGTSSRCGIVTINSCRALDNGGNALNLSQVGSTSYRFIVNNLETIWNAWNTSIAGLFNAEVYFSGQNNKLQQCAFGDPNGDTRTVMGNGDPRLPKSGNLGVGVFIRSGADNILIENCRYISLNRGVQTSTSISFLRIQGAYFTQQQISTGSANVFRGFDIGASSDNVTIDAVNPGTSVVTTWIFVADSKIVNAIQNPDYGTFTPTITFATPGDLSVSYLLQSGAYSIVGNLLYINAVVTFTPTYTTASGVFLLAGLNTIPNVTIDATSQAALSVSAIFSVDYGTSSIDFVTARVNSSTSLRFPGIRSATSPVDLTTTNIVSGTANISLRVSGVIPLSARV
jgi:hypothetical protein